MPDTATPHIGKNIERIRTIRGIKQETLASALGVSQGAISKLEQSPTIDDEKLKLVADALDVSVEAIKNFNEDKIIYNIQNNYDNATANVNYQHNPIEKIVELYERLLQSEREKNQLLENKLQAGRGK